jgi:hypothetical protein
LSSSIKLCQNCVKFFFLFWDRVSLCNLGWPQTCDPSFSVSWMLGVSGMWHHAWLVLKCWLDYNLIYKSFWRLTFLQCWVILPMNTLFLYLFFNEIFIIFSIPLLHLF